MSRPKSDTAKRFWSHVAIKGLYDCWEWQSCLVTNGYGGFNYEGSQSRAHRIAWILTHGDIPGGKLVLHSCDNRKCVNPAHLYIGTQGDNIRDICDRCPDLPGYARAKLSKEDIQKIRHLKGRYPSRAVGPMFGVGTTTILNIWKTSAWLCKEGYYI